MKTRQYRYFVGDFETTVYEGQTDTEVWASAIVELNTEDVKIHHSIAETFSYLRSLKDNIIVYYHNLKFDGNFWLSYFLNDLHMTQAVEHHSDNDLDIDFLPVHKMPNNSISYSISDMGAWYTITVKVNEKVIEFRDSLKLLPFSVKKIGKSFETKHKKLDMEYTGYRYAGCEITEEEQKYIANDVLVIKEALEIMFAEGHTNLTIGSCCLSEYKKSINAFGYDSYFPDLTKMPLNESLVGTDNVDRYIRNSYHGGWCYVVRGKENQIKGRGITADVNSLYPSMMHSESGNRYPIGQPTFWIGNYIPEEALGDDKYYFVRIRTKFYIKNNMLPCIQIKHNLFYKATEWLDTSDIKNKYGYYVSQYTDLDGKLQDAFVTLTLTMTDYELVKEHYDLVDCTILDGCWFYAKVGLFDDYINKYKKIKMESKGAKRELAKLFLNNLYGKMAASTNSSFKYAYVKEDGSLGFYDVYRFDKLAGYIAVGSAITSYARNFTIRAAQQNYYGVNEHGFIYADTDSIHCDLPPEQVKGIKVDPRNFCCWKLEATWDSAIFVRQKTYIEHVVQEDLEDIDKPYYNIRCAGMPEFCKQQFVYSLEHANPEDIEDWDEYTEEEQQFMQIPRTLEDFKVGLIINGKLLPKHIKGGILLCETTYEMR